LLAKADALSKPFRERARRQATTLKLGAIDTAAAGLVPMLLHDFRECRPDVAVQLLEDKTIRLLPRLLSGRLDLALVRPPEHLDRRLEFLKLFHETAVVAVPACHKLAGRKRLSIRLLSDQPLIVPDRRSRPHSHDLTIKLFSKAGLRPQISQVAEEKQTIVNLVAANLGLAIVPRWASRLVVPGVRYIPVDLESAGKLSILPLAAARMRGSRDPVRDDMLAFYGFDWRNMRPRPEPQTDTIAGDRQGASGRRVRRTDRRHPLALGRELRPRAMMRIEVEKAADVLCLVASDLPVEEGSLAARRLPCAAR